MKKAVVFGLLLVGICFILWHIIAGEISTPVEDLAMKVDKENFEWFTCPSCGELFFAEATTRKGSCPYCGSQMMLVSEVERVIGRSVDESKFVCFFSPKCKKVFFAYETQETGKCPYCAEVLELIAPVTAVHDEESDSLLLAWTESNFGAFLTGIMGLFVASVAGIYVIMQSRTILSLKPVEGVVSEKTKIELSKWKTRKKKITLGDNPDNDIILKDPSLKDVHCILSFVRVGGKTHAYLRRTTNQPIWINEKPEYNARLHDHDKVKLGEVIFEVSTKEK